MNSKYGIGDNVDESTIYQVVRNYILKDSINKWMVILGIPAIIIQFIVFKYFYPFAGFINGDSFLYLETAYHNFTVNTYPIGYSKLLRLISVFTHSDIVVVAFQYLFLEASVLFFLFTIFYFYSPNKVVKVVLYVLMITNPVSLYLANYISSDSFFLSLSLIWFTLLIWIMNKPSAKLIIINSLLLFIAFTVRYNALFYPVIGSVALLLVRRKVLMNLIGFSLSMLLIGLFVMVSSEKYRTISGHYQFTPFTGWQMANNALYAYRYVDSSDRKTVPQKLSQLDGMVRNYFDSSRNLDTHPSERLVAATVYMWSPTSPLSLYMEGKFKTDSTASALKKWATVAPVMNEYGTFLIRTYPREFVKYYLVPNAIKYYVPPVEFLKQYSTGVDSVNEIAKVWFDYKDRRITCRFKDFEVSTLNFYPVLTGTMNVVFILGAISFVFLKGYRENPQLKRGLLLVIALWVVNFGFSVFASPIALRFQLFPIIVSFSFAFLLIDFLLKSAFGVSADGYSKLRQNGGLSVNSPRAEESIN